MYIHPKQKMFKTKYDKPKVDKIQKIKRRYEHEDLQRARPRQKYLESEPLETNLRSALTP